MNNFKTTDNGGLPLVLNDFRWIDAGYRDAFKGLIAPIGITGMFPIILEGCVRSISGGIVTISGGYIAIAGEVCKVNSHSYPTPGGSDKEYWAIEVTYDPTGNKNFQSTNIYDTYETRVGKILVASTVPAGSVEYADTKTYWQHVRALIPRTLPTALATDVFYRTDVDGFVHLEGRFFTGGSVISGAFNTLIGTLPVGSRPPNDREYAIHVFKAPSSFLHNRITIATNGEVRWIYSDVPANATLDFSQIPPFFGA